MQAPPRTLLVRLHMRPSRETVAQCPVRLERSLSVEGVAVAGESVEDLLRALVPGKGSGVVVPMARIVGMPGPTAGSAVPVGRARTLAQRPVWARSVLSYLR